jgi:hypothetical protein
MTAKIYKPLVSGTYLAALVLFADDDGGSSLASIARIDNGIFQPKAGRALVG